MTRRVAFGKAIRAGAAGAIIWALLIQLLELVGVPVFDMVRGMGTLLLPHAPRWQWMTAGLVMHAAVGAAGAIFYAYFFWSEYPWRPAVQGLVFAIGPALLAGIVMVPQLHGMNPQYCTGHIGNVGMFARHLGPWGPIGLLAGHAIYGLTLGSLYTHPVGYSTRAPRQWQRFWRRAPNG